MYNKILYKITTGIDKWTQIILRLGYRKIKYVL